MTTIRHGDRIRLASWVYATASVATLIGFHKGDEAAAAASRARHPKEPEVFAVFAGTVLSDSRSFYERDKALHAAAVVVADGETVEVDGLRYAIKVMSGNDGRFPRNSDPIHFIAKG